MLRSVCLRKDLHDSLADMSGVSVAWQVDEHRNEPAVVIFASERPRLPPFTNRQNLTGKVDQLLRRNLEQLVAREGLAEVQQVTRRM